MILKKNKFIMKSTPKYKYINDQINNPIYLLEYELENCAEESQII